MSHSDKIEGDAIVDAIAALIEDNTLIRIKLGDSGEEGICIINSQRPISDAPYFQIDMPETISIPQGEDVWETELCFDFMGRDRLNYSFKTTRGITIGDKLWLKLPPEIERIQQRNNFRVNTPRKALLEFSIEAQRYSLILENISLGGAFCRAKRSFKTGLVQIPVKPDSRLEDLHMIIPMSEGPVEIHVQRSRVARIVRDPEKRLLGYGVEFLEIGRQEKTRLTRVIYDLQRQFLKHRLK